MSSAKVSLVTLLIALAALASSVSPALAQLAAPSLSGTHPSSPGLSTSPRIFGLVSGISTSGLGRVRGSALTAAVGEEETITIYEEPGCAGAEVATGSPAELSNSGIQVNVAPGSTTTFSATNSDFSGVSNCSNSITYMQVSNSPNMPIVAGVNPASPADENQPHVFGSADTGATVAIYANPSCAGAPVGIGSASAFSANGIQVNVPDNSTTTFYARATWAELPSACSSTSATYQEVSAAGPAPGGGGSGGGVGSGPPAATPTPGALGAPKLRTVPGGRANDLTPLVTGSVSGAVRVQIYRNAACTGMPVASGPASQLSQGFEIPVAENATTRFYGEAIGAEGKISTCSDPVLYVEDSTPPDTRITFGPGVKTRKRIAVFRFTDISEDPPGTIFLCKLDRAPWKVCQAPLRLPRLQSKAHTLQVKARDAAGNEEAAAKSWRFKVVHARR